jgi:hypothetical protein
MSRVFWKLFEILLKNLYYPIYRQGEEPKREVISRGDKGKALL